MKITKSIIIILMVMFLLSITFSACNKETASGKLDVYVWEGYLPEEVTEMFEEETGIKLNINLIADNASIFTLLKGGGQADVIMPTQNQVNRFYTEDLILCRHDDICLHRIRSTGSTPRIWLSLSIWTKYLTMKILLIPLKTRAGVCGMEPS